MPLAAEIRHEPNPCPKSRFPDRASARAEGRRAQSVYGGGPIDAYRCATCSGWHLGHDVESARPCRFGCGTRVVLRLAPGGTNRWAYAWETGERHLCPRFRR